MSSPTTNKLKSAFETVAGLFGMVLFFAVSVGFLLLFFKGATWITVTFLPILAGISGLIFWVLLLVALPLSLFKRLRGILSITFLIGSYVFGVTGWLMGFAITYYYWGLFWVFVGLFMAGIGVMPLGIAASAFNGNWGTFWLLIFMIVVTYGCRVYAIWLAEKYDEYHKPSWIEGAVSEVVDIDPEAEAKYIAGGGGTDPLLVEAIRIVSEEGSASAVLLQSKLKISYTRTVSLIDELEALGIVGKAAGAKPRKVYMNKKVDNKKDDELANWEEIK